MTPRALGPLASLAPFAPDIDRPALASVACDPGPDTLLARGLCCVGKPEPRPGRTQRKDEKEDPSRSGDEFRRGHPKTNQMRAQSSTGSAQRSWSPESVILTSIKSPGSSSQAPGMMTVPSISGASA